MNAEKYELDETDIERLRHLIMESFNCKEDTLPDEKVIEIFNELPSDILYEASVWGIEDVHVDNDIFTYLRDEYEPK